MNIWTAQHNINSESFSTEDRSGGVLIEEYVWIASRSTILPKVAVKKGCVLASGGVLTKTTTEEYAIYGGVPARIIGTRNRNLKYTCGGNNFWMFY